MPDVFDAAKIFLEYVKKAYPEDIAIVAYYGSYAQGAATKRSDLDLFFIPATDRGYKAAISFILADISFDFWPISWERAEKMATFEESKTTIIADSKLLYARNNEDHAKFMKLRETTARMQEPTNAAGMFEKAEAELREAYVHLYNLSRADESKGITFYKTEACVIIEHVLQSLALLNGTYYTRGFGKNREQLLGLPIRTARLEPLMDTILRSSDRQVVVQASEQLAADVLELIEAQKQQNVGLPSYAERMSGFYEELKGVLDKIVTACEMNDYDTAFFASIQAQEETARFLYFAETGQWPCSFISNGSYQSFFRGLGFPDMVALLNPDDLSPLQAAVVQFALSLEQHLRKQGVPIKRFAHIGELAAFLNVRQP